MPKGQATLGSHPRPQGRKWPSGNLQGQTKWIRNWITYWIIKMMSNKALWGQLNYPHASKLPWLRSWSSKHLMKLGLISFQHTAYTHIISFNLHNNAERTVLGFFPYLIMNKIEAWRVSREPKVTKLVAGCVKHKFLPDPKANFITLLKWLKMGSAESGRGL